MKGFVFLPFTLVTALKSLLSTSRTGKISSWYSLTSKGSLHLRPHSFFFPVLLYSLRKKVWTGFSPQKYLRQEKYSLKLCFQLFLVIPVLHITVAVRIFSDGQYFKHQNAKGPNIAPENGNKPGHLGRRQLNSAQTRTNFGTTQISQSTKKAQSFLYALSNLCNEIIVFAFYVQYFKPLSRK